MSVSNPFQITEQDIARSSTLTMRDQGKWALLVDGCYQLFDSEQAARECWVFLLS